MSTSYGGKRIRPSLSSEKEHVKAWEAIYRKVKSARPLAGCKALLAYNTVLDRVVKVDAALISKLPKPSTSRRPRRVTNLQDFADTIAYSILSNVALEVVCEPKVFAEISKLGTYKEQIGGQVAIISNLLSKFEKPFIVIHADRFDRRATSLYKGSKALVATSSPSGPKFTPAREFIEDATPQTHYIFEYNIGTAIAAGAAIRSNRLIACPNTPIVFQKDWEEVLPSVASLVDFAFLAGLNHMGDDYVDAFYQVVEHIRFMRMGNPDITVHLELTSTQNLRKLDKILEIVVRNVDSIGLNEAELTDVMDCLGYMPKRGPLGQVEGMLTIMALGPKRVNLHTMDYYLCKVRNTELPSRDGMVYGAIIGAAAAVRGAIPGPRDIATGMKVPVSKHGINMLKAFEQVWLDSETEDLATQGYLEGFGLAAIPTKVVAKPKGTVGLGDMISSISLAAELSFRSKE